MLIAAFTILAATVLFGAALAVLHLRLPPGAAASPVSSRPPVPWRLAALHGLIGIGGLGCLLLGLRGPPRGIAQGTASFGIIAAALIVVAAMLGGAILLTHLRGRRAGALIGVHAALAISGFVILAAYLLV